MTRIELIRKLMANARYRTFAVPEDLHALENPEDSVFKVMAEYRGYQGTTYGTCRCQDMRTFHRLELYQTMKAEAIQSLATRIIQAGGL